METAQETPGSRSGSAARSPTLRSRVTNGGARFFGATGRSAGGGGWADGLSEILSDLGHDGLSEGQRQLARRCATIAIACERMEGEAAQGNEIDLDAYGQLTDRLGRALQRLGLKRQARNVTPTLADYLQSHHDAAD